MALYLIRGSGAVPGPSPASLPARRPAMWSGRPRARGPPGAETAGRPRPATPPPNPSRRYGGVRDCALNDGGCGRTRMLELPFLAAALDDRSAAARNRGGEMAAEFLKCPRFPRGRVAGAALPVVEQQRRGAGSDPNNRSFSITASTGGRPGRSQRGQRVGAVGAVLALSTRILAGPLLAPPVKPFRWRCWVAGPDGPDACPPGRTLRVGSPGKLVW